MRHTTTLLPKKLREELGLPDTHKPDREPASGRSAGRGRGGNKSNFGTGQLRKDRRREEREQKKTFRRPGGKTEIQTEQRSNRTARGRGASPPTRGANAPKSILKRKPEKVESESESAEEEFDDDILNEDDDEELEDGSEEDEEEEEERRPSRSKSSRSLQDMLAEDDAEIAALEKALGIKGKKKLPKAFMEDGLDEILGDLADDSEAEDKKRKREGDEWLQRKRRKAVAEQRGDPMSEEEDQGSDDGLSDSDESEATDDSASFGGFDEDEDEEEDDSRQKTKTRENPYIAPVAAATTKKYIPPSLRTTSHEESESLSRLRRLVQGHLNKLSEANLLSILSEIEQLYQAYPRQNVTSTLVDLLLGLICDPSTLSEAFINLHAGFIAAIYKVMGMDFGAQIVQRVVEQLDGAYEEHRRSSTSETASKEMGNLVTLISHLYNLHVIGCGLMFDYIRLFLTEINELNTELLLKIIKSSGPQLRQDDPSSLKDIVLLIQPAISQVGEAALSVRTKFMIETINDLKNNKLRSTFVGLSAEQITRMRKILGSLNSRNIRASEPLRIGREDIHNSAKTGKWWLVGASWKNEADGDHKADGLGTVSSAAVLPDTLDDDLGASTVDLAQLARDHRMNTDVRRSIFVAIMSATDCRDAQVRLGKLRLKRKQEVEIPRVLIHCASEEESYNPYYTLIARKLCGEKRLKMAFMFALWDVFKRIGERNNMEDSEDSDDDMADQEGENTLNTRAVVNLAKMYGNLVADGALTLGVLKVLDFLYLQQKTRTFLELLLITAILQTQKTATRDEKKLADVFMRTRDTPQVVSGLIFFLRKVVSKSDIVSSKREKETLKWGCRVALDSLRVVAEGVS